MRKPDKTEELAYRGLSVRVDTWVDPTDIPYDGDNGADVEGCEGWDVLVRATYTAAGHSWQGVDSLGSIWVTPGDAYLGECVGEVRSQALSDLFRRLRAEADGDGITHAKARQASAVAALGDATVREGF